MQEEEDSRTRLIAAFSHAAFSNSRASAFDFMRSETFLALTSNVAGYDWLAKALQSAEPPLSDLISFLATKVREQSSSAGVAQAASQGGSSVIVEMNPFRIAWGSSIPPVRPVRHDDLDAILEALDKALPAKKPLKMVLFRGIVDWEMMHSSFRVFDVEGSALGDTGMQTLSDVLCRREFRLLAVLNLRGNSIDDMGAQVLAKAFFHLRFLTLVDVSGNSIGTKGAKALAEQLLLVNRAVLLPPAWRVPLSVPLLDLSGNFFGAEDAEALIVQLELLYVPWLVPHSHCISLLNSASVCSLVQAGSEGQEDRTLLRIKIDAPLAPPEVRPGFMPPVPCLCPLYLWLHPLTAAGVRPCLCAVRCLFSRPGLFRRRCELVRRRDCSSADAWRPAYTGALQVNIAFAVASASGMSYPIMSSSLPPAELCRLLRSSLVPRLPRILAQREQQTPSTPRLGLLPPSPSRHFLARTQCRPVGLHPSRQPMRGHRRLAPSHHLHSRARRCAAREVVSCRILTLRTVPRPATLPFVALRALELPSSECLPLPLPPSLTSTRAKVTRLTLRLQRWV